MSTTAQGAKGGVPSSHSASPVPSGSATGDKTDGTISNKLDLLTSLVMVLAEKTNEALGEVAKLNERISTHSIAPLGSGGGVNAGFHLDVPKQPKGWKEGPSGKSKERKGKGGRGASTAAPQPGDKDATTSQDSPRVAEHMKRSDSDEETKKEKDNHEDESVAPLEGPSRRPEASTSDQRHPSPGGNDMGAAIAAPLNVGVRSRAGSRQITPSRPPLNSRTSMSSIDLNDMHEMESLNTVIKLNVGGRQFCTTRSTLTCFAGSMFDALLSGRHAVVRDSDGAIFLDRDPDTFEHVLTYLRDPRQLDLRYYSAQQQQRILCEMDYFMVPFQKIPRELPHNFTGHVVVVERENQWTMKWTNRGWWVGGVHDHQSIIDGSSSGANALLSAGSASQGIPTATSSALATSALKMGGGSGSGSGLASPVPEAPPQLKFVDDLVYVNMKNRPLRAYDLWTGQCLKIIKDSYCDCFAVMGEQLVTYDADDQSLRLWNTRTSSGVAWIKADVPPTNVSCLSFINDSILVLGGDNNKCVTLNLSSAPDQPATATTVLQGANLKQIEPLSPSVVAVGSTNGNIILWNIKLNVLLGTIPTAQQRISTIFARQNYIYCISPESIKVWDCSTNPSKPYCVATIFDEVSCLDADGDLLIGVTADRSRKSLLKIWSLSSSKLVHVMPIPAGENVHTIRVQGPKIATVLDDGTVLTWTINLVH